LRRRLILFAPAFFSSAMISAAVAWAVELEKIMIETGGRSFALSVEIADHPASREHGLMFRRSLPENHGMLFKYEAPQRIAMWMKNTFIPLDMIFIRADGTVSEVASHTVPHSLDVIQAAEEVSAVLEVNAGLSERLGIRPGAVIRHRFFGNAG
jgi:uncharacterized membrane protein (UPF0127 family)